MFDTESVFLPLTMYATDEVLEKLAELKITASGSRDLRDPELRRAALATFEAMRMHLTGDKVIDDEVLNDIQALMFD